MFTHIDKIQPVEMKVVDTPKGRFYTTPNGDKYPSVTTVLSDGDKPWLKEWRNMLGEAKADKETKRAAARGTAVHLMMERFLQNNPTPTEGQKPEHIAEFNSSRAFLKKVDNILAQETALYSDTLKIAGRVDCIAEFNGVLSVVDFKTSTRDKSESMVQDYFLQTTAYALMFDEMYNIRIDNIAIIMTVEKGIVPLVYKRKIDEFIEPLCTRINKYYEQRSK